MATKKPLIVCTRPIPEGGLTLLKQHYTVKVYPDKPSSERELISRVKGASAIVSFLTEPITRKVLEAAGEDLKIVAQFAVGYDNIDLQAASDLDIVVTNTPGFLSGQAVAEHAAALLLTVARHIVPADAFMKTGKYKYWDPNLFLGPELAGKTLGLVGSGQIGSLFAAICHHGFGMKIRYHDLARNHGIEKDLGALKIPLKRLLAQSDVVSLHVPLFPATRHLIDQEALELMKTTAILINTSRGPIIDELALVKALKEGLIAGAGLDVYEFEPRISKGLAKLPNVVATPHIGSATLTSRKAMAECAAKNVIAVLNGKKPQSKVN